jgi:protein gp37
VDRCDLEPMTGWSKVSPSCGCADCYAETLSLPLALRHVERLRAAGAG